MATKKKSKKVVKTAKTTKAAKATKVTKVVKATKPVSVRSKVKAKALRSFQVFEETAPFFTFKITEQTIYWAILSTYILLLSLWVLGMQLDVVRILDKVNL